MLVVAVTLAALETAPAMAQVELTAQPMMTRGAPGAPVTIVEFSDYQ